MDVFAACPHAKFTPIKNGRGHTIAERCAACTLVFAPFDCKRCGGKKIAGRRAGDHNCSCGDCTRGRRCVGGSCRNCARLEKMRVPPDSPCARCGLRGPLYMRRGERRHAQMTCLRCRAWYCDADGAAHACSGEQLARKRALEARA